MARFSSRMCDDFVILVEKVALLERELRSKKLHVPRDIQTVNVAFTGKDQFQKILVTGKFGDEHPIVVPEAKNTQQKHFQALVPMWDTLESLEERVDGAEASAPGHFSVLHTAVSSKDSEDDRRVALMLRIGALERALRIESGVAGATLPARSIDAPPNLKRLSWLVERVEDEMDIVISLRTLLSRCALRRRKRLFAMWKSQIARYVTMGCFYRKT